MSEIDGMPPKIRLAMALVEKAARRKAALAQDSLAEYARYVVEVEPAKHHLMIIDALESVERGEINILIIMAPPGSAKSTYASVAFPAWYLGRHPERCIIAASHTVELAERFGRRVRNLVASPEHRRVFPGAALSADSTAAGRWDTAQGGEYYAAGVGGSITGRRADLMVIDDPVRSREDADSEVTREKQWSWWQDDATTRLKPGAGVVVIACMVGETKVLMADGTEKELRYIRPGDSVATYRDGELAVQVVRNWVNNGPDAVFKIEMSSGAIVKANERHPFLVCNDGKLKWIRTRDLRQGHEIVRVNGGSGKARLVRKSDVKSQPNVEDIVPHITTKNDGQTELGRRQLIQIPDVKQNCSIGTVLAPQNMIHCSLNKAVSAQYAGNLRERMCALIGAESYALITATIPERLGRFFAMTATLLLGMRKLWKLRWPQQNTSDFTLDKIVEITASGIEEVFDVQIDHTENFIANGLVSHNTRWHEDDLIGRLLIDLDGTPRRVEVLSIPMEAREGDILGRAPGELLWPEWYTEQMVADAKREPRTWTALYQQEPRPIGGGALKAEWIQYWGHQPAVGQRVILVDPSSGVNRSRGDFTAMWVIGTGADGNDYVLDGVRDRLNLTERTDALFKLVRRHKPVAVGYEQYGLQADIEHIRGEQERQQYRFRLIPMGGALKKEDRIRRLIPSFQQSRIWMPRSMPRQMADGNQRDIMDDFRSEYLAFPVGAHDDSLDCLSRKEDAEIKALLVQPRERFTRAEVMFEPSSRTFGY